METTTFLGAILGLAAVVLVLFLYISRKWCFHHTHGGFPCCDDANTLPSKYIHKMGKSGEPYAFLLRLYIIIDKHARHRRCSRNDTCCLFLLFVYSSCSYRDTRVSPGGGNDVRDPTLFRCL